MDNIKTYRTGRLNIVSSGYSDRYVVSNIWLVIEKNGVKYRIDNDLDRIPAYVQLQWGLDISECTIEQIYQASAAVNTCPITTYIKADSVTFATTSRRLTAGIHAATGYVKLSESGINNYRPIAETLTKDEWNAVRLGLDRINKIHATNEREIVPFEIPGACEVER